MSDNRLSQKRARSKIPAQAPPHYHTMASLDG